mmetsp:Transcript_35761/g.75308  ORF Transcript_35761/g.75308 Transcript_35761/m.75308 type:complete len:178 (-) Transcript_35761:104-637(-)
MKQIRLNACSCLAVLATYTAAASALPGVTGKVTNTVENIGSYSSSNQFERVQEESCGEGESSCSDSEYCHREAGLCDGSGVCKSRPEICTMDYTPVCGCDNEVHSNSCKAYSHGTSVNYVGECNFQSKNKGGGSSFINLNPSPVEYTRPESSGSHHGRSGAVLLGLAISTISLTLNC